MWPGPAICKGSAGRHRVVTTNPGSTSSNQRTRRRSPPVTWSPAGKRRRDTWSYRSRSSRCASARSRRLSSFRLPRAAGAPRTITRYGPPARGKVAEAAYRKVVSAVQRLCLQVRSRPDVQAITTHVAWRSGTGAAYGLAMRGWAARLASWCQLRYASRRWRIE